MNGRVRGDEKGNLFLRGNPTTSRNKIALNKNAASFYASSKSKYKIQVPHISQTKSQLGSDLLLNSLASEHGLDQLASTNGQNRQKGITQLSQKSAWETKIG